MSSPPTAYAGSTIVFATMHGKEELAREAFRDTLGATVMAPHGLDTDRFGTFAGDIPRTLAPRHAARAKARLGMQLAGGQLGLASEGSFSAGFGPLVEQVEIVLFIDDDLGLELVEGTVTSSRLPSGRDVATAIQARDFAEAVLFPVQGVVLQSNRDGRTTVHKDFEHLDHLQRTAETLLAQGWSVIASPDYRAHRSPSRAETIRSLCARMANRLATNCRDCGTPGFGHVDVEHGLPCSLCGVATQVIAADIHGCGTCLNRTRISRPHERADPTWCDSCNP